MGLSPFRLLSFEGPRPVPGPWSCSGWGLGQGKGTPRQDQGPGVSDPLLLLLLPPAPGRWRGDLRPLMEGGPQRMRGAERSLVTVGRSFTVAKGLVPRGKSSGGCCSQDMSFLTSVATPMLPMLLRRLPGKGVGAGLGARLGTRLGVRERGWPSQYSEGAVGLPGRSRRSSRLWLPRSG